VTSPIDGIDSGLKGEASMREVAHELVTRRRVLRALVLLGTLSLGFWGMRAQAAGDLDFTLKNRLGVTINSVYVSPHRSSNWEEDVLDVDVLPDGRNVTIRFPSGARDDLWDLKVVDTSGRAYEWRKGFNLRQISEITVYFSQGQAIADSR
jgi:hypothetical protein